MANFSSLVRSLPFISHPRASGSGYGLWLTWQDQLSNSVVGTLQDYGAFCLCAERDQALWFSSNTDVFRALARLKISAQLLSIPVFIQVFPATFQIASDLSYSLAVPSEILKQSMESREELDIWIHPKHSEIVKRISGLRSHARANAAGLSKPWMDALNVDENLEHTCLSLSLWYFGSLLFGSLTMQLRPKSYTSRTMRFMERSKRRLLKIS